MNIKVATLLRCIWTNDGEHQVDAHLEKLGGDDLGLLRCRACYACYLIKGGVPIMLPSNELPKDERRLLKKVCEKFGVLSR